MKTNPEMEDAAILELIRKEDIHDQHELVSKLNAKGFALPQSTLSRRLQRLGVAKLHNIYRLIEPEKPVGIAVLSLQVSPPNLILLRTLPGHASSLAFQLDQKIAQAGTLSRDGYQFLLGTIAGDDTVLVIADGTKEGLERLKNKLKGEFKLTSSTP